MKKLLFVLFMLGFGASLFAQQEEEKKHEFRRDNIFIGGAIAFGLSNGGFSAGANPEIGYTVAKWLDAGISTNFNYYSYSAEYNNGYKQHSFNYGAGVFARVFPIRNIFLQVLPEYNRINTNLTDAYSGEKTTYKQEAPSLLLGIGYATRDVGRTTSYILLMFDAGNNKDSPYINYSGNPQPILRAGFNFYLRARRK